MTTSLVRCLCALVAIHVAAFAGSACGAADAPSETAAAADEPSAAAALPEPSTTASSVPAETTAEATDAGAPLAPDAAPVACPGAIEVEPNDVNAQPLGAAVCGKLAGADVDSFSLPVKEDARVTFAFQLTAGATIAIDGAGVHVDALGTAPAPAPITVRAKKKGVLTVTLSKPVAPLSYILNVTRL